MQDLVQIMELYQIHGKPSLQNGGSGCFEQFKKKYLSIELGMVEAPEKTSEQHRLQLSEILSKSGLQLLDEQNAF